MFYAQLDASNKVIGISDLHSVENLDHLIPVDSLDSSLIGKVYDGTTFIDPMKTLDEIKQEKITELEQAYYSSFMVFQSSATGVTKTYPINQEAQDNFERLQRRLIADPNKDSFSFYTLEDANLINHTRSQFLQLLDDAEAFEVAQHIKLNQLKTQVEIAYQAGDIEALQCIAW